MKSKEELKCDHCHVSNETVARRRQHTAYNEDELNFRTYCEECQKVANEYWDERWQEYWSGRL